MLAKRLRSRVTVRLAGAAVLTALIGFGISASAETNDDRISECMYAGYRPGSGMFAACVQPQESSGLGALDSPQFAPAPTQLAVPLPAGPSGSDGAPNVLLDAPDYQSLLQGPDEVPSYYSPVWDRGR